MTAANKTLLVIGAGVLQAPAIRRAARMGLRVLATDMDPAAPGLAAASGHALISTLDIPATVAYAQKERIDGVLTLATDIPLNTVAAVARACGLPGPSPSVAERATNKYKMKQALAARGVPCPRFTLARTAKQAARAADQTGWPAVVKPIFGAGSRGVFLAQNQHELAAAFSAARKFAGRGSAMIEEFARGRHVCVETFSWQGRHRVLCAIDRSVSAPPHFVELEHRFPSALPKSVLRDMERMAAAGLDALGVQSGPAHIDMIVTARGPLISEIGARLDGDYKSSHFMPLVFGYDIIADAIRAAMGQTPLLFEKDLPLEPRSALCIHYLQPRPGTVARITGKSAARSAPGVAHAEISIRRGTVIKPFASSHDRVGVIIARGQSRPQARDNARRAAACLRIEYAKT